MALYIVGGDAGPAEIRLMVRGGSDLTLLVGSTPLMIAGDDVPLEAIVVQNKHTKRLTLGQRDSMKFDQGLDIPAKSQWTLTGGVSPIWGSPNYYDRNPLSIFKNDFTDRNGAGFSFPWTYAVPAGRRFFLEQVFVEVVVVDAVTTGAADSYAAVEVVNAGGPSTTVQIISADFPGNLTYPAGTRAIGTVGVGIELQPGETVRSEVAMQAGGSGWGRFFTHLSAKGTEFDA